ncbi:MAG: hypothetical protein ACRDIX_09295 [Actinomycetota bacterium]
MSGVLGIGPLVMVAISQSTFAVVIVVALLGVFGLLLVGTLVRARRGPGSWRPSGRAGWPR